MTRARARARAILSRPFVGYVALVAALLAGAHFDGQAADRRHVRDLRASCERGNMVRGYLLLRAREFKQADDRTAARTTELAPTLFPVLDCSAQRPLTLAAAEDYLATLLAGREPIIRGGFVVGSRELEPPK